MKLFFAIALLAIVSCNNAKDKSIVEMPGTYRMLSQTVNDGTRDTTYTKQKQLKIYTPDYMMYVQYSPSDSISRFGVGAYTSDSGNITENIIYSAADTAGSFNTNSFTVMIEKTNEGYNQVIPEIVTGDRKYKLTEAYESVGKETTSPLDGVWEKTGSYILNGADTVNNNSVEFKTYYKGYFMYGLTYKDSANRFRTGMGYGSFSMEGTDKVKENVMASTFERGEGGITYDIDVEMADPDNFKQTLTDKSGNKSVEVYKRVKK